MCVSCIYKALIQYNHNQYCSMIELTAAADARVTAFFASFNTCFAPFNNCVASFFVFSTPRSVAYFFFACLFSSSPLSMLVPTCFHCLFSCCCFQFYLLFFLLYSLFVLLLSTLVLVSLLPVQLLLCLMKELQCCCCCCCFVICNIAPQLGYTVFFKETVRVEIAHGPQEQFPTKLI